MLETSIILGIIVGYLRGGKLQRLARLDFPYFYLIFAGLAVQALINLLMKYWPNQLIAFSLLIISYLLLLSAIWLNRGNEFLFVVMIGLLLNFFVIALNGGMPVSFQASKMMGVDQATYEQFLSNDFKHVPLLVSTKLKFLADIIPLPRPYPLPQIFSVGDIFISLGIFFFLQDYMRYTGKHLTSRKSQNKTRGAAAIS